MPSSRSDTPVVASAATHDGCAASDGGLTIVLLARSAFAAAPFRSMTQLARLVAGLPGVARAAYAFSEQGEPALRKVLRQLTSDGVDELVLLPLILPMEPGFEVWLHRALDRWSREPGGIPKVRIGGPFGSSPSLTTVFAEMIASAAPAPRPKKSVTEASLVPAQRRRVLVCHGGPCNNAGAAAVWVHLRNEQERLSLRNVGDGTMTAKSTCLGPCSLAPVVQVWPEGTVYGGVDETALDDIIASHLIEGRLAEDLAYHPTGRKQTLRSRRPSAIGKQP